MDMFLFSNSYPQVNFVYNKISDRFQKAKIFNLNFSIPKLKMLIPEHRVSLEINCLKLFSCFTLSHAFHTWYWTSEQILVVIISVYTNDLLNSCLFFMCLYFNNIGFNINIFNFEIKTGINISTSWNHSEKVLYA